MDWDLVLDEEVRNPKWTPERRLWGAVLQRAISDLRLEPSFEEGRAREVCHDQIAKQDAIDWFRDRSRRPFSFRWVCSILNLDVQAVIDSLKEETMAEKTYKGKSMKYGGGGRFAKFQDKLEAEGKSAASAGAIAAAAGRKAHGAKSMAKVASAGRGRARGK